MKLKLSIALNVLLLLVCVVLYSRMRNAEQGAERMAEASQRLLRLVR